jgi:hypothetical protein
MKCSGIGKRQHQPLAIRGNSLHSPHGGRFDFRDTNQAGFDGMAVFEESPFFVLRNRGI